MEKIKRRSIKTACSLLLSLLLVLSGIPLEGVGRAFAATEVKINQIRLLQTVEAIDGNSKITGSILEIDGENLQGIQTIQIRPAAGATKILEEMGAQLSQGRGYENFRKAVSSKDKFQDLNFTAGGGTTIKFILSNGFSITNNEIKMKTSIPTIRPLTSVDLGGGKKQSRVQYIDENLDPSLKLEGNYLSETKKLLINGQPVLDDPTVSQDSNPPNLQSITIDKLPATVEIQSNQLNYGDITFEKEESNSPIKLQVTFKDYITPIKRPKDYRKLEIRPPKGSFERKNYFDIIVYKDEEGELLNDKINTQGLEVFLKSEKSRNPTEIPLKIINSGKTSEVKIQIETPPIGENQGSVFDVIVQRDGRVIAEKAYELLKGFKKLKIKNIIEDSGKNSQPSDVSKREAVMVSGENIFRVDPAVFGIEGTVNLKRSLPDKGPEKNYGGKKFTVYYDVSPNATYSGKKIKSIKREISLRIGQDLEPKKFPSILSDAGGGKTHYHNRTTNHDNPDGVVFLLPEQIMAGTYDVQLKTETIISYIEKDPQNSNSEIVLEARIPDEDVKKQGFTYKDHPSDLKVSKVEPTYGYYHTYNGAQKPLLLRFTGENFKVERASNGELIYPTVRIYDLSMTEKNELTEAPDQEDSEKGPYLKVTGRKILDDKDKEVVIEKGVGTGSQFIVEIQASAAAREKLRNRIITNSFPSGVNNLGVKFTIINPDGGRKSLEGTGAKFFFRHPAEKRDSELRKLEPYELKAYDRWDKEANVFSSSSENELILKFKLDAAELNLNEAIVTMDGKEIKIPKTKEDRYKVEGDNRLFALKLKIPKGLSGKKTVQLILQNGLMDSIDLDFTDVAAPWLKSVVSERGPKGTWMVITRDADKPGHVNAFFLPPTKPADPETGSRVIISKKNGKPIYVKEYKVINQDTIEAKIPDDILDSSVEYRIEVENPGGIRSNALTFTLLDIGDSVLKIGKISPNRGNPEGGIETTITAAEGYFFGKPDGSDEGPYKVYFGNQESKSVKLSLDRKKLFVTVPALESAVWEPDKEYPVRVTVQNALGATDSIENGFTYFKPSYQDKNMKIEKIFKKDVLPETNKGKEAEVFIVQGLNFRVIKQNGKFVLPLVKFGYADAEVIEPKLDGLDSSKDLITFNRLTVKVPEKPDNVGKDGNVTVYVINNDGGTAKLEKGFTYIESKPQILSGIFRANRLGEYIYVDAKDVYKEGLMVAFGSGPEVLQEKDLSPEKKAVTEFLNPIGDLQISYEYKSTGNTVEVKYRDPNTRAWVPVDGGSFRLDEKTTKKTLRIPWKKYPLKEKDMPAHFKERLNDELIYVNLNLAGKNEKLIVRRMLGEVIEKDFRSGPDGKATVYFKTPYHKLDLQSSITLINADGADSGGKDPFEFHANFEVPAIKDIINSEEILESIDGVDKKIKVYETDYSEESIIYVTGENLKDIDYVMIGETKIDNWLPSGRKNDELTLHVPAGKAEDVDKLQVVKVITKAGAAFSDKANPPVYFKYIYAPSKPSIESITPDEGPRTGGTRVLIKGKGFKDTDRYGQRITGAKGLRIEVDGIYSPATVKYKKSDGDITEIEAFIPASRVNYAKGKVKLTVINPDKGKSAPKDFTYISQPVITGARDMIFFNDAETEVTLRVEDLQEGAEVIIGAEMKKGLAKGEKKPENVTAEGILGVRNGENQIAYAIGGQKARDVKVSKEKGTLSFKLPAGIEDLKEMSVIIKNSDKGISEPKNNIIKRPIPDTPIIYADPGAEGSVVLSWKVDLQALNAAEKFEVYAKLSSDSEYTFVGDTKQDTPEQAYIVKGLEQGTSYDFKVRVLNKFGEAKDLGYVRGFTLSASGDYKQKEKQEAADRAVDQIRTSGKKEIVGTTLRYTLGAAQTAVDFTKEVKYREKQLQIPVRDILGNRGKILHITDGKINLQLNYSALSVPELSKASGDAFLRLSLSQPEKKKEDALRSAIGRKKTRLSPIYKLDFELVEPKKTLKIKQLAGTISIGFPAGEAGYPAEYIERNDRFERLNGTAISKGGYYVLLKDKNK